MKGSQFPWWPTDNKTLFLSRNLLFMGRVMIVVKGVKKRLHTNPYKLFTSVFAPVFHVSHFWWMDLSSSYSDLSLRTLLPTTYLNTVYAYETSLLTVSSKKPYDILLWLCTGCLFLPLSKPPPWVGQPTHSDFPRAFLSYSMKVSHPRKPFSPRQLVTQALTYYWFLQLHHYLLPTWICRTFLL